MYRLVFLKLWLFIKLEVIIFPFYNCMSMRSFGAVS